MKIKNKITIREAYSNETSIFILLILIYIYLKNI